MECCDGIILGLTPAACASEAVQYEIRQVLALSKTIFPVMLEHLPKIEVGLKEIGLAPKQHIEDFTGVPQWNAQMERLPRDLRAQGLTPTRHEQRQ